MYANACHGIQNMPVHTKVYQMYQSIPTYTKHTDNEKENVNDKDNEKVKDKENKKEKEKD
jgi:hypothetical protein